MTKISTTRILVSNDDGINAAGIELLEKIAGTLSDDVWVVAPESEKSGAGHSLTLTEPLRVRQLGEKRFAVRGTPTDCVLMAVKELMPDPPTLLLSGINRGGNLGEDVTYSGTVAAAMEGTLCGVPAIALSQCLGEGGSDWSAAEEHARDVIVSLVEQGWPANVLMNVNFPRGPLGVKGVKVCEQGFRDAATIDVIKRIDARGFPYYWFGLGRDASNPGHETDLKAIRDGYITVTPLHLDLTHGATMRRMAGMLDRNF